MNFLQDLRRRRMFRLVGLYIVGAWVVIQVAQAAFEAWGIPDEANRFVWIAAALCFPIALVFGWIFDITSEGIVRTRKAEPGEKVDLSLRQNDYVILAALLFVGVVVVIGSAGRIQEEIESGAGGLSSAEMRPDSIAVLPLQNLDAQDETGYFSAGVTDEIMQRLSQQGDLHVFAGTSIRALLESGKTPQEVSEALGVSHLLDGSVRRMDDRVRLTARLLDAHGMQLWSETYDRDISEFFAVQVEIANSVARQIVHEIVPLASLPAGRTTDNIEAYNAYLIGRFHADRRVGDWRGPAEEAFKNAIELDPGFAPPYAGLAVPMVVNTNLGSHWDEAADLARKSLQLDPQLAEGHAILGLITTLRNDDPVAGAELLRQAIELDPVYSFSYPWLSTALILQGLRQEARDVLYRGAEIDPLNPVLISNLADMEESLGNYEAAAQLLRRLAALPQLSGPAWDLVRLHHDWGRYADEIAARHQMMLRLGPESTQQLPYLSRNFAALGMTSEADFWLDKYLPNDAEEDIPIADLYFIYQLYDDGSALQDWLSLTESHIQTVTDEEDRAYIFGYGGLAQIQVGEYAKGIEWVESSLELYRDLIAPGSTSDGIDVLFYDEVWWTWLVVHMFQRTAFAYQQLDRIDDADQVLQQLDEILASGGATTPIQHEWQATQYVLKGEFENAHASLSEAVELGWANYYELINNPAWKQALTGNTFEDLLAEARSRVNEQAEKLMEEKFAEQVRNDLPGVLGP